GRGWPPSSELAGQAPSIRRQEADRHRRTVRGDQGAGGRVLVVAGALDRRSHRVAQARTLRRRDLRDSSDLRHRGYVTAATEAHRALEAIWRIESARLIDGLASHGGAVGTAEEPDPYARTAAV